MNEPKVNAMLVYETLSRIIGLVDALKRGKAPGTKEEVAAVLKEGEAAYASLERVFPYRPGQTITRAQAATALAEIMRRAVRNLEKTFPEAKEVDRADPV